ncbi:MAG: radical SAM protein [bacterium]|nr:radical SAM protein [bacterium]
MRILGVYANINRILRPPPLGLMMIGQNAMDHGHEFKILDFFNEKRPDAALLNALQEYKPDLTAFSFRNLDNQRMLKSYSYIHLYKRWVETARQYSPTVIGGSAFSTYPKEMMAEIPATYGFEGQGNRTFAEFLEEVENKNTSFNTPGVLWREGDKIKHNKGLLEGYPTDGHLNWDLIDPRPYKKSFMSWAVITKTGCPHGCTFCDSHVTFGDKFVTRDPDVIVEELRENQRRRRMNRFTYIFIDDILNEPIDWAKTLMEKIIRSDLRIGFGSNVEPTEFDRELIGLMRDAGCLWASGFVVSADDDVLAKNKKCFTQEQFGRFMDLCEQEKLVFMPHFMVGSPGETEQTLNNTLDFISRYKLVLTETIFGVRIQKGAPLYQTALKKGIIKPDDNLLFPKFYFEPSLSLEWAQDRINTFRKKHKSSVVKWNRVMWGAIKLYVRN